MKQLNRTKVTVRIRKAAFRNEWYLCIESYPVFVPGNNKPQRIVEALNRTIPIPTPVHLQPNIFFGGPFDIYFWGNVTIR